MNIDKAARTAFRLYEEGTIDEARKLCEKILAKKPKNFNALHLLGIISYALGQYDSSVQYIRAAIRNNPDIADAYFNLGAAFRKLGRDDDAVASYQHALRLNPDFPEALSNLGAVFQEHRQYGEAVACLERAIQLNPALAEAYSNLGTVVKELGRVHDAEICYRQALQRRPDLASCYSNLLYVLHFGSRHDPQAVFSEHLRFARQYADPLADSVLPHANERTPDRRLKVGYISPDLRRHSVAYFIEPVIASHNREGYEVFCYASSPEEDEITSRIRGRADHWKNIAAMSDEQAAGMVREDGIDILVDLAGHTAHNRMLLFARKPAPVQATWIGYPATTGLSAVDYKIVDDYTDPPGMTEQFYTEKLLRIPGCFLCYLPDRDSPGVGQLPALRSGHVTFGSLNDFAKISPEAASVWREILLSIPGSRILIKAKGLSDKNTRKRFMDRFAGEDISPERITLLPFAPSTEEHLNVYTQIDIALDTFPYNGTTTTCEALWMGVPVITLAGATHASRVGVSLLSNIGLPELIAGSPEEYRSIALGLAADKGRLESLREGLRAGVSASPLTDAAHFTEKLERCFRQMWSAWCRG